MSGVMRCSSCSVCKVATAQRSREHSATDASGARYQIKSQCITSERTRRRVGVIRNLDDHEFDWLVAALFDEGLNLLEMRRLSHSTVARTRDMCHTRTATTWG